MRKFIIILLILIIFSSAKPQLSEDIDMSECFLADAYLSSADFVNSNVYFKEQSLSLQFHVYHYFSSCYDIEVLFQKQNNFFRIKKTKMEKDGSNLNDIAVFSVEVPIFELQSICEQASFRRMNNCQIVLKIYRKNTRSEVAQTIITAEALYSIQNSGLYYIQFKMIDIKQQQTQFRSNLNNQIIQQTVQNSPVKVQVQHYESYEINPYYPIKVNVTNSDKNEIINGTIYGESSMFYQLFKFNKFINLNMINYPTKNILSMQKGHSYSRNSTDLISDDNSTQITLTENRLTFYFNSSFDIVQEIRLADEIISIKAYFRVQYIEGKSFMVERLPFFTSFLSDSTSVSNFDLEQFISNYLYISLISFTLFCALVLMLVSFKKSYKKAILRKEIDSTLQIINSQQNEQNNQQLKDQEQSQQKNDLEIL